MFLRVLNTAESVVCILSEALDFGGPVGRGSWPVHTPRGPGLGKKRAGAKRLLYASMGV